MTRKIIPLVFISLLLGASFGAGFSSNPKQLLPYYVTGDVYDSEDGKVEIYNDTTKIWSLTCKNITVYSLDRSIPPAVNNGSEDQGKDGEEKDQFLFDAGWRSEEDGKAGIAVGEAEADGKTYVFITDFIYAYNPLVDVGKGVGECNETQWEPLPEVQMFLKKKNTIGLTIPKFSHPTNAENTIGFAVFRDQVYIGSTQTELATGTGYSFTDFSAAPGQYDQRNYSVAPITRGNFYVAAPSTEEPEVALKTPTGGERLTGGSLQNITYEITGGLGPYTVYLNYSTTGGEPFDLINITSVDLNGAPNGTYTHLWELPLFAGDANFSRVNVTVIDSLGRSSWAVSEENFIIDCTKPTITVNSPLPDATNVSIFEPIDIQFSEAVDKLTAKFTLTPSLELTPTWIDSTRVRLSHPKFEKNEEYTCRIEVKDLSLPGNTAPKTWSFTTASRISLSLLFPYSGARLTGNVTQEIKYVVGGGIAPYNVTIQFWNGTSWDDVPELDINLTGISAGTYTGSWRPPALNTDNAKLKLRAEDVQPDWFETPEYTFSIDSISPMIVEHYPESDGILPTTAGLRIVFSEAMNKTSVIESFSLVESATNAVVNVTPSWENDRTIVLIPEAKLTSLTNYTVSIAATAKDRSIPGNNLEEVRWNFTALEGRGDLIVDVDFPILPKKGDTGKIVVTVYNTGEKAYNYSGMIVIKFYQSEDGISWTELEGSPKTIPGLLEGAHASRNITLTFERAGDYYFRLEVYSMSPLDLLNDRTTSSRNPWGTSAFIRVEEPPSFIGPYTLLALMVVIVIVIALLTLASYRKGLKK